MLIPRTNNLGLLLSAFVVLTVSVVVNGATITTNGVGSNWNDAANWDAGVPGTGDAAVINHNMTLNADATVASITINAGKVFTEDGSSRRISIEASGSLTNNGTWTGNTETIDFEGTATIDGSTAITANNMEANGAITVTTAPTINGTLEIKSGGSLDAGPNYGTSSTLKYNNGGTYNRYNEWIDTDGANPGYPHHVHITGSSTFNLKNGTNANRFCGGDVTVDAGSTFDQQDNTGDLTISGDLNNAGTFKMSTTGGGDVFLYGDYTNTGTYTPNSRTIAFYGTAATQTLTETSGNDWDYFASHKTSGTLKLMTGLTINANKWFTMSGGGSVDLNDQTVTIEANAKFNAEYAGNSNITNSGSGTALVVFEGGSTFDGSDGNEEFVFGTGVKIEVSGAVGNMHYTTVNGEIEFKTGGYPNGNAPVWGSSSTVTINIGSDANYSSNWNTLWNNTLYNWTIASGSTFRLDSDGTISSSGLVTVNGSIIIHDGSANRDMDFHDVTIGAAGTINMNNTSGADLTISGDFTCTSGGTMQTDDRSIAFDGTGTQVISGDFGAQKLDHVDINNSHATQGVELECDMTIDIELRLVDGYLFTQNNFLILDSDAAFCNSAGSCPAGAGDADSHLVCDGTGGAKIELFGGTDAIYFPIASAPGEYIALGGIYVDDNNDNLTDGTLAAGMSTDLTMASDDDEILNPTNFVQTLVQMSHTESLGDGISFRWYWPASDEGASFSRGSGVSEMYHLNGSDVWVDLDANYGTYSTQYYHEETMTSFSPFAIGSAAPAILPIELGQIEATYNVYGKRVVRWETLTELNNSHFIVQRSLDGEHFVDIGRVEGKGTTAFTNDYFLIDDEQVNGITVYYQLIQVDFDGTETIYDAVALGLNRQKNKIEIYPNPSKLGQPTVVKINGLAQISDVRVIDPTGRVVWSMKYQENTSAILLPELAVGGYYLLLESSVGVVSRSLFITE